MPKFGLINHFGRQMAADGSSVIFEESKSFNSEFAVLIAELDMAVRNGWRAITVRLTAMKSGSGGFVELLY